ncbi:reverse transcriptase [Phytophthora megakarya]|uniref:Reverse transcriptase n=1 Tax=Phytophthora megakarya TaxID=4795 RepID=A0A225WYC6_9STRA|nr:reverse transcriptase [Phytophthora megakarya]
MTERADSLRALVDLGAPNNFVRQQLFLPLLDFEEKHTEKRAIPARLSYKHPVFVEALIILALDDKFDMVLGMWWLARHDPIFDWEKRTAVRFKLLDATESDDPDTPSGASEPLIEKVVRVSVFWCSARAVMESLTGTSVWSGTRHYQEIIRREASK